jgi:hypothetical protein
MLLPNCCPNSPGMIADGFLVKEFWPYGRLAQSMAFFNAPGIERFYSGVTKSTASMAAMAALKSLATLGKSAS